MFNKNKKEKSSEYEKAEKKAKNREKIRSYDEFYKHPVDKKKIILSVTLVLTIILFVFIAIIAFKFFDKNGPETPVITQEPTISAEELYNQELKKKLSNDYTIGLTTKKDLINNGIINLEASGKNYLIKNSYTNINNIDYLTTFFLKDDILVGILHEAMLDTTTKYKLSTKFQTVVSELNQTYKNIEISERWFGEEMKYDTSLWNDLIINNKLELVAELASGSEFIKVIASGVPYFDYKYNNTFDKSFGNLAIIYSNGANQGLFKQIETIDFNEPNEEESTDVTTEPVVEETQTTEGTEVSQTTEN